MRQQRSASSNQPLLRRNAQRYDDTFRKYSKRYFGIGFDWRLFKAQGMAESNLDSAATSWVGARGIMQLMPATFQEITSRNPEMSRIDDPEWNIAAGIFYDRQLWKLWAAGFRRRSPSRVHARELQRGSWNNPFGAGHGAARLARLSVVAGDRERRARRCGAGDTPRHWATCGRSIRCTPGWTRRVGRTGREAAGVSGVSRRPPTALDPPPRAQSPICHPPSAPVPVPVAQQFIYVMKALAKVVPPSRVILDDIWLSFYPGAKIGVLGANGAGKTSLLRIMAGVDQDFQGEAWAAQGTKIGYLPQEPQLDPSLDVRGNVELAVKAQRDAARPLQRDHDRVRRADGRQGDGEAARRSRRAVQEQIDALDLWNLDNKIEVAMDALRCPPATRTSPRSRAARSAASRCAACCSSSPDMLLLDEPTNHLDAESVAWLEQHLADFPGTVVAITHDRYFLDNVAKWILELDRGSGIPYEGNYSSGWSRSGRGSRRRRRRPARASARWSASSSGCAWRRARVRPRTRRASRSTRSWRAKQQYEKIAQNEIVIPPAPRLGNDVVIAEELKKAFGDKLLFDDLSFCAAARRHRRHHRA